MFRPVLVLTLCLLCGSFVGSLWSQSLSTRKTPVQEIRKPALATLQTNSVRRPYTLSFKDAEIKIELTANVDFPDVKMYRLQPQSSSSASRFDRFPMARKGPPVKRAQAFTYDRPLSPAEIVPFEIVITSADEDAEPLTAIVYVKTAADGKRIETTWSEYACVQKIYVCGKDRQGRPAMQLRKNG